MTGATRGTLKPGDEIDGFAIEAVAGRGGMGVVYRARQKRPDRVVALKVIAGELADDPAFRERFQRESALAAQLEHPNVIPVHAVGEADGILYIAMRFVDGVDLRTVVVLERALDPRRAAAIIDQVGQALDAAHAHGLVHRDVKPANILLSSAGGREHAYLTDFGLARLTATTAGLTNTGAFLGTIDYIAPEQARGERVDARADVYSLGCTLFQALTGTVPYPLDNEFAKLYAHDRQPPPSVRERNPQLPAPFEGVLARAMAKAPDDRYLSAGDLGRAALAAAAGETMSRAERNVAAGAAAPEMVEPVAPSTVAPDTLASETARPQRVPPQTVARETVAPPMDARHAVAPETVPQEPSSTKPEPAMPPRKSRAPVYVGVTLLAAAAIAAVIVAVSGGGSSPHARAHGGQAVAGGRGAVGGKGTSTASGAVGFVPGRRIGVAALGEPRRRVSAVLVGHGYTKSPGSGPQELHFYRPHALFVIGFDRGLASYIQEYQDAAISYDGVTINSTPRAASRALPSWRLVRCRNYSTLIAPGGLTYFYLAPGLDQGNGSLGNGIAIEDTPYTGTCA